MRSALRRVAKRAFRTLGYDISRIDPDRSLGEFLRSIFQHYQINCVVDVGANDGQYARFLRELGYRGQIVSFEPVASVFERLAACAAADARWDVHRLALGNEDGCREIHVAGNSPWSSFHRPLLSNMPDHYPGERVTTGRERVTVGRLDDIFTRVVERIPEPRAYLKLDTQGWDLQVLAGAERSLEHVLALQTEISLKPVYADAPDYSASIETVRRAGFEIAALFPVSRYRGIALIELDCIAARV